MANNALNMRPGNDHINLNYTLTICSIAATGGFLFGFDTAVISGALSSLSAQFTLDEQPVLQGWVVSSVLLGSVIGAGFAGILADRFGRKNGMIITALLYLVSAIGSVLAPTLTVLIIFRLIGGLGVGIAAMVIPTYISEISPARIRGAMVTLYQLAVTIGVLVAFFSNSWIGNLEVSSVPLIFKHLIEETWRAMLGTEIFPALAFLLLLFLVPASPRYLLMKNKPDHAFRILSKLGNDTLARQQVDEISKAIAQETSKFRDLFRGKLLTPTSIALFLAVVSQLSGIDIFLHYGPLIMERAGFSLSESLNGQVILGVILVLFTVVAVWKVDALGRKKLLFWGNIGIALSLFMVSYLFYAGPDHHLLLIIAISIFIACFSFSLGPLPWIIMSEIFPTRVRGRAVSMGTLTLFGANWLVAQVFPILSHAIGEAGTFLILGLLMLPTFVFLAKVLPETKGRSLEEIERSWVTKSKNIPLDEIELLEKSKVE